MEIDRLGQGPVASRCSQFAPIHVDQWNILVHWRHILKVFGERTLAGQVSVRSVPPVTVEINPIDLCNHSCTWCFTYSHRETDKMSPEGLDALISDLGRSGARSVHFAGGGEPTLFRGLISVKGSEWPASAMVRSHQLGMSVGLITNGSRLGKLDLAEVVRSCAWVRVSIDAAYKERYRRTHQPRGHSLQDVHDGIAALLVERGSNVVPSVGASFIIDSCDEEVAAEVFEFCRQMAGLGVDYIQVKPENENRGPGVHEFMRELRERLTDVLTGSPMFVMMNDPHQGNTNSAYCWYSHMGTVVGADGSVYVCCYTYGQDQFRLGKIDQDRSFDYVWQSPERRKLVDAIDPGTCRSCRHSSANLIMERIYQAGPALWATITSDLASAEADPSRPGAVLPDEYSWLQAGLDQYRLLLTAGYNPILDFPAYRPTLFIRGAHG